MARTHEQRIHVIIKITEYSVETVAGELVSYFTWKELMKFLDKVKQKRIHAQAHRWDKELVLGEYVITPVEYWDEVVTSPKGIVRLP